MFAERVAESVRKDTEKNEDANIMITREQKRRLRRRLQRMVAVIVQYKRGCWVTRINHPHGWVLHVCATLTPSLLAIWRI